MRSLSELNELMRIGNEDWIINTLRSSTKADHGYSCDLPAIVKVVSVMCEFTISGRHEFLEFITWSSLTNRGICRVGFRTYRY